MQSQPESIDIFSHSFGPMCTYFVFSFPLSLLINTQMCNILLCLLFFPSILCLSFILSLAIVDCLTVFACNIHFPYICNNMYVWLFLATVFRIVYVFGVIARKCHIFSFQVYSVARIFQSFLPWFFGNALVLFLYPIIRSPVFVQRNRTRNTHRQTDKVNKR